MTNREVLAQKSNEELAKWLDDNSLWSCAMCEYGFKGAAYCGKMCKRVIQQWLEQEAKDETIF